MPDGYANKSKAFEKKKKKGSLKSKHCFVRSITCPQIFHFFTFWVKATWPKRNQYFLSLYNLLQLKLVN